MNLVFIDVEAAGPGKTGGLDPHTLGAEILELALVAVDARTLTEIGHWSTVLNAKAHWTEWDPYVQDLHTNSGLLKELKDGRQHLLHAAGGHPYVHEAEEIALQFMAQFAPDQSSPMCGANVGSYDRRWLRKFMPKLEAAFHYRCLDTNGFFLVDQLVFGLVTQKTVAAHRALADCRQSIDTLRAHCATLYTAYTAIGRIKT